MKNVFFYETDIGEIGIAEDKNRITNIYFKRDRIQDDLIVKETELIKEAAKQLKSYLSGERKEFELPLDPAGTKFMISVWNVLQSIPYGETCTYGEIAKRIDNPKASRAVGLANNRNPIPIFIPCHRVIGTSGKLVGYLGGLEIKEHLLQLEKNNSNLGE